MNPPIEPPENEALNRAIGCFDSLAEMARALDLSGYQVIQQWKKQGRVPAEHCPPIERLSGVRCEDLNDKVDWAYLRGSGVSTCCHGPADRSETIDDAQPPVGGLPKMHHA